jgi:integrase/recombinase XerD
MKRECISRTLKNIAKRSGLDKDISNHSLRHSFVSTVAEEFGIEVARVAVSHKNIGTTQRYTHTQEAIIRNVMLGFKL